MPAKKKRGRPPKAKVTVRVTEYPPLYCLKPKHRCIIYRPCMHCGKLMRTELWGYCTWACHVDAVKWLPTAATYEKWGERAAQAIKEWEEKHAHVSESVRGDRGV